MISEKLRNRLYDLKLKEVSVVDKGANPGSVITFWKRDSDQEQEEKQMNKREMSKSDVLKAGLASRGEAMTWLDEQAQVIAKRDNVTREVAFAKAMKENPDLYEAYATAPVSVTKKNTSDLMPPPRMTPAEAALDAKAKKRSRQTGESFAKAYREVLKENPDLYQTYSEQKANGTSVACADLSKQDAEEDDSDCPSCGFDGVDAAEDIHCKNCGAPLAAAFEARRKRLAAAR
jgi:GrpB-like predicted nucleotidyltransferase (UPF0157 family)